MGEEILGADKKMFDKKNKRSSSRTRDDSPEYGFENRSDVTKLYWDGTVPGRTDLTKTSTDHNNYTRNHTKDINDYPAYENSNKTYKSSYVSARKENTEKDSGCALYNSRPASSLGMNSFHSPISPGSKYAKQRRGSVSDFENNSFGSKFTSCGSYWRSKSIDMSPNGFTEYQRRSPGVKAASYKSEAKENGNKFYRDEPSSISSNIWSRSYQKPNNIQYEPPALPARARKPITRSEAFDTATQFSDTTDSQYKPSSYSNGFHGCDQPSLVSPPKSRLRHKTLAYGVSKDDLNSAKSVVYNQGSNEDMKKVLLELDNTGYFSEVSKYVNSCLVKASNIFFAGTSPVTGRSVYKYRKS